MAIAKTVASPTFGTVNVTSAANPVPEGAVAIAGVVIANALLALILYVIATSTSSFFQSALVFASPVIAKDPTVGVKSVGLVKSVPVAVGAPISTESKEP